MIIIRHEMFMSAEIIPFPLGVIRTYVWKKIQEKVQSNNIPYEKDYHFLDANGQTFTVWIEISQDDVLPDVLSVTIMVDNYPCKIDNNLGIVSALFSIQNIEDCQIYANGVQIQNTTAQLDNMELMDIERYVAESWNKEHPSSS
jgi:hypothetical protein